MGADPKFLDDIARVAGGAVNLLGGLREQVRDEVKSRMEDFASRMDLVPREDFEQLQAMVKKLRLEQERMEKRLAALEGKKPKATKAKPKIKTTAAKAKTTKTKTNRKTK